MAVYTEVTDEELTAFVAEYEIGEPLSCKGIAEGIENSNYLLTAEGGTYILTLYEKRVHRAERRVRRRRSALVRGGRVP